MKQKTCEIRKGEINMPQPRKLHIIKRRRGDGEGGMGTSNSSWVASVMLKSSSPAQELLGDVAWLPLLPPAQLDQARRRAGRLHRQLCADVFH